MERDGGFVLHIIHILGNWMKALGIDGLSRGDLTKGMMSGQDPLSFVPFNKGADERLGGQVSTWVHSWWRTRKGSNFGGFGVEFITKDNMFELRGLQGARLWMMPLVAMEVAMELLCGNCLAHPQWPHVFVVSCLMIHFWRKDLMKSTNLFFTVPAEVHFWAASQFKPLIFAIVWPLSHVAKHTGPGVAKGTPERERTEQALRLGFKGGNSNGPVELHDLEGALCGMWEDPEGGVWIVLQLFLAWASNFPPVQKCMVRGMLARSKRRPFPQTGRQRGDSKHQQSGD